MADKTLALGSKSERNHWRTGVVLLITFILGGYSGVAMNGQQIKEIKASIVKLTPTTQIGQPEQLKAPAQ